MSNFFRSILIDGVEHRVIKEKDSDCSLCSLSLLCDAVSGPACLAAILVGAPHKELNDYRFEKICKK